MPTLTFSHKYPKLWGQTQAELIYIAVMTADYVQTQKALLQYDTMYVTNLDVGYYQLPKQGQLIQLTFIGNKHIPFCTLRRYTTEKFRYYQQMKGRVFDIEVKDANH